MTETCGYTDGPKDYYENAYECDLPPNHEGLHSATHTWATRAEDICAADKHLWGPWRKVVRPLARGVLNTDEDALREKLDLPRRDNPITIDIPLTSISSFLADTLFPPGPGWEKEPTRERRCTRCGDTEDDGVLAQRSDVYAIYGRDAFPPLG